MGIIKCCFCADDKHKMADYTCTLDEATLEKAEEELHEVPDERAAAIETFREWILDRPYIKCPTGLLQVALSIGNLIDDISLFS